MQRQRQRQRGCTARGELWPVMDLEPYRGAEERQGIGRSIGRVGRALVRQA